MNVFFEFHKIVQHLQEASIEYALVGGVAAAFHDQPRFTRDVDFLISPESLEPVSRALQREGYRPSAEPWAFKGGGLTLHRFIKTVGEEEMIVDILVAGDVRHRRIIDQAVVAESKGTGPVRVASKADLIWLKQRRNSKQDQADIARLEDEKA